MDGLFVRSLGLTRLRPWRLGLGFPWRIDLERNERLEREWLGPDGREWRDLQRVQLGCEWLWRGGLHLGRLEGIQRVECTQRLELRWIEVRCERIELRCVEWLELRCVELWE